MARTPVNDYRDSIVSALTPVAQLDVRISDAVRSMVAADVTSPRSLPTHDVASHDGYAVAVEDIAGATTQHQVTLPVTHDVTSHSRTATRLVPGAAVRVASGALVPDGATAVVAMDDTDSGVAQVAIKASRGQGWGISTAGSDLTEGELICAAGSTVSGRQATAMLAAGLTRVAVRPAPRVVIIPVGDDFGGTQWESTSVAVAAVVTSAGATAYRTPPLPDDRRQLRQAIEDYVVRADVILTVGGASPLDTVVHVLESLGPCEQVELDSYPVLRMAHATIEDPAAGRPVTAIALPGNPVRAVAAMEMCVRPALKAMGGALRQDRVVVPGVLDRKLEAPKAGTVWMPVTTSNRDGGTMMVSAAADRPWSLSALAAADAFVVVTGETPRSAGTAVPCFMWDS